MSGMEMLAIFSPVSLVHLVLFHNGVWQVENTTICGSEWHGSPAWLVVRDGSYSTHVERKQSACSGEDTTQLC